MKKILNMLLSNQKLEYFGKKISQKFPFLRKYLIEMRHKLLFEKQTDSYIVENQNTLDRIKKEIETKRKVQQ